MTNRRTLLASLATMLGSSAWAQRPVVKSDERVVLFDTDASFDAKRRTWQIPIHGWIHELESARLRRAVVEQILATRYQLRIDDDSRANFERRARLLMADNERGKRLTLRIGGRQYPLPPSGANGHFMTVVELDDRFVERHATNAALPLRVSASGLEPMAGHACLIQPQGLSVISDIDDTVKISEVTDRRKLLANSLLHDFVAVPGMAAHYRAWSSGGANFHFVSSSPWHLYEPLGEFLCAQRFPAATISLKMIRLKDASVANLWRDGAQTKPAQITPILERFPQRRFVLVGDSGEQDPEVYGAMARRYPDQVARVCIRNVTNAKPDDPRFKAAFAGPAATRWQLFSHPGELGNV